MRVALLMFLLSLFLPAKGNVLGQDAVNTDDPFVMLLCNDVTVANDPAFMGYPKTVDQACDHLRYDRRGSTCTVVREGEFAGKRVLCDAVKFNSLPLEQQLELRKHESVHLVQYRADSVFGLMVSQGIASADDPTPNWIDPYQDSFIGVTEWRAQIDDVHWHNDYEFALVRGVDGERILVRHQASVDEARLHLHTECGDPTGTDQELDRLLMEGLYNNISAYNELIARCTLPPHQLIPDRIR